MNKGFDGFVMTLPHVVDEALDRAMPAETRQAKRIVHQIQNLSSGVLSLSLVLCDEKEYVKVMNYETNHMMYAQRGQTTVFIENAIDQLLVNSLAIGERTALLLDQMRGYLEMMSDGRPSGEAIYVAAEVKSAVEAKTIHHTTD